MPIYYTSTQLDHMTPLLDVFRTKVLYSWERHTAR